MADALGSSLLSEIEEERLDQLLRSLQTLHLPPISDRLGVPCIDILLNAFLHPQAAAPHGDSHEDSTKGVIPQSRRAYPAIHAPLARNPVIEITSLSPSSGKTQLLYHFTARALLPKRYNGHPVEGKEGAVVWLDMDSRFSILRLEQFLVSAASQVSTSMMVEETAAIARSSLQHLHCFRPQSSAALLETLDSIPAYLFDTGRHFSAPRLLRLVILSNLSAFLWQDRNASDEANHSSQHSKVDITTFAQTWRSIVQSLRALQATFDCTIVAANIALSPPKFSPRGAEIRPHLPAVWSQFVGLSLLVKRQEVSRFGPGLSVMEALQEANERLAAVVATGFTIWVNQWERGSWDRAIEERYRTLETSASGSMLIFDILDRGVEFRNESSSVAISDAEA